MAESPQVENKGASQDGPTKSSQVSQMTAGSSHSQGSSTPGPALASAMPSGFRPLPPEPSVPKRRHLPGRICPMCGLKTASRARRRNPGEYLISMLGIRPYYCQGCEYRFLAFRAPRKRIHFSRYASCPKCYSEAVHTVSKDRVPHALSNSLWRLLSFPAYRCSPCRVKFFSLKPLKPVPGEDFPPKKPRHRKSEDRSDAPAAATSHNPIFSWARCPNCNSSAVSRVSRDSVPHTWGNYLWRLLRVSAYRCPECREKFFTIWPMKQAEGKDS